MTELDYQPTPCTKWETFKLLVLPFLAVLALFYAVWYYTHQDKYMNIKNSGDSSSRVDDSWFVDHSEIPFPYINMDRINTNSGSVRFKSHGKLK